MTFGIMMNSRKLKQMNSSSEKHYFCYVGFVTSVLIIIILNSHKSNKNMWWLQNILETNFSLENKNILSQTKVKSIHSTHRFRYQRWSRNRHFTYSVQYLINAPKIRSLMRTRYFWHKFSSFLQKRKLLFSENDLHFSVGFVTSFLLAYLGQKFKILKQLVSSDYKSWFSVFLMVNSLLFHGRNVNPRRITVHQRMNFKGTIPEDGT